MSISSFLSLPRGAVLYRIIFKKKKMCVPPDHFRLCAPGAPGQQGISEWMEGATRQEYQRGCLQPHPGGARRGTGPLLPQDPGWRAQTDQVGWIDCKHFQSCTVKWPEPCVALYLLWIFITEFSMTGDLQLWQERNVNRMRWHKTSTMLFNIHHVCLWIWWIRLGQLASYFRKARVSMSDLTLVYS